MPLLTLQQVVTIIATTFLTSSPRPIIHIFVDYRGCEAQARGLVRSFVSLGTRLAKHFLDFSSLFSTNDANTKRLNSRMNTSNISTSRFKSPCKSCTRAPSLTPLVELQPLIVSPRFVFQVPNPPLRTTSTHSYIISDTILTVSMRKSTHFH